VATYVILTKVVGTRFVVITIETGQTALAAFDRRVSTEPRSAVTGIFCAGIAVRAVLVVVAARTHIRVTVIIRAQRVVRTGAQFTQAATIFAGIILRAGVAIGAWIFIMLVET